MPTAELVHDVQLIGRFEAHRIGEHTVYFDPGPHRYYSEIKENKKSKGGYSYVQSSSLIGCSTPVKALDSDPGGLMNWAAKLDRVGVAELAGACLDSEDSLEWLRDPRVIGAALHEADLTWYDVRKRISDRGTNVHELIFLALATGERPPSLAKLSAEERAYGQAAIRWWRDNDPTPLYAEQVTYHPELRVAGRFDLLCEINGERVLVDAKTRDKGVARRGDHAQLAGYELCNVECGIGGSDRQVALLLKPDGTYDAHDSVGEPEDFLAALDAYRRGEALGKRMEAAEKAAAEA